MRKTLALFFGLCLSSFGCLWDRTDKSWTCGFAEIVPDDGWLIIKYGPNQEPSRSGNSTVYCRTLTGAAPPVVVDWAKRDKAEHAELPAVVPESKQQEFTCEVVEEAWGSGEGGAKRKMRLSCEVR